MACGPLCNRRASAARGWVNAWKLLISLDLWRFAQKCAGGFRCGDCHCVDTMSTQWRCREVLWELVGNWWEGNAGFRP